jgi:hypothetical protein
MLSKVYCVHFSLSMMYSFSFPSKSCEANCCFIPLVTFVPSIKSVAFSTGQCGQLGLTPCGPRALAHVVSASKSACLLSRSSRVRSLPSRSACPFTHCTLVGMSLHHSSRRVWYVFNRSQSHLVLWYILAVRFWFHLFTAASLSQTILTDRRFILPDLARTPIAASPAQLPPSSDRYEVI